MDRISHDEDCTHGGCTIGCGWQQFHDWLDAPLTKFEVLEDQRFTERRRALERGEIPA